MNKIVKSNNALAGIDENEYELLETKPNKRIYRRKYGMIRISGEKELRRITFAELKSISDKSKLSDPNANAVITSQKIKIPLSKIVFQEVKEERTEEFEEFAKLPTTIITLNEDFTISNQNERYFIKNSIPYILATAHVEDGKPILEPVEKIKSLCYLEPSEEAGYPHQISKIIVYGEKTNEIDRY